MVRLVLRGVELGMGGVQRLDRRHLVLVSHEEPGGPANLAPEYAG